MPVKVMECANKKRKRSYIVQDGDVQIFDADHGKIHVHERLEYPFAIWISKCHGLIPVAFLVSAPNSEFIDADNYYGDVQFLYQVAYDSQRQAALKALKFQAEKIIASQG